MKIRLAPRAHDSGRVRLVDGFEEVLTFMEFVKFG
jgi:hypothetical protein